MIYREKRIILDLTLNKGGIIVEEENWFDR